MISQQAAGLPQCFKGSYPVRWAARRAVVALPERTGHADAGQVSEDPLPAVNRGADALIVEMTATISCNYTGADALPLAVANGTEMRPTVTGSILRRALSLSGLNHLISIYPSLEAAIAASEPAPAGAGRRRRRPGCHPRQSCGGCRTPRMTGRHWHRALVLASRRPEGTFSDIGKRIAWPPGRFADRDGLREARPGHGTAFAQATTPRPAGTGHGWPGHARTGHGSLPRSAAPRCTPRRPSSPFHRHSGRPGNRPQASASLPRPAARGEHRHATGIWPPRSSPACPAPISACGRSGVVPRRGRAAHRTSPRHLTTASAASRRSPPGDGVPAAGTRRTGHRTVPAARGGGPWSLSAVSRPVPAH